jgi:hypothetical protein
MEGGVEEVHKEGEGLPGIGAGAATCLLPLLVGVAASTVAGSLPPIAPRGKCMKFASAKKNPGSIICYAVSLLHARIHPRPPLLTLHLWLAPVRLARCSFSLTPSSLRLGETQEPG